MNESKWRRDTHAIHQPHGWANFDGYVNGLFGIRRVTGWWAVIHLRTGAIVGVLPRLKAAKEFVARITPLRQWHRVRRIGLRPPVAALIEAIEFECGGPGAARRVHG